jgi:hypothetical protein
VPIIKSDFPSPLTSPGPATAYPNWSLEDVILKPFVPVKADTSKVFKKSLDPNIT